VVDENLEVPGAAGGKADKHLLVCPAPEGPLLDEDEVNGALIAVTEEFSLLELE